ncbi:MAG: PVC-type heme-binding CxxCH protein [Rubripirellula sp.]
MNLFRFPVCICCLFLLVATPSWSQSTNTRDARNATTNKPDPPQDPALQQYGIYAATAPRAQSTAPVATELPLELKPQMRIAMIGNMLLERSQNFGYLETLLHQKYPQHELVIRHLGWPADTVDLQPRPDNFADVEQHLHHEKTDLIIATFGFNESFQGPDGLEHFRSGLQERIVKLKSLAFNGASAPSIVLLSPIANENIQGVPAADLNNKHIQLYAETVEQVAKQTEVGFVDLFASSLSEMSSPGSDLTINGVHLNDAGYALFGQLVYQGLFGEQPPQVREDIRQVVIDKNRQFFRRYRPLNTFYYTGGRSKTYGYLDFLPAMRNFDIMTANRDARIWDLARGNKVSDQIDDSNLPPLPETKQSRGANRWMSAKEEQKAFKVDPRFEVSLFAGEEEFPDIAAPIQMRWDNRGRLWISCSTTYPHVYPGNEPDDKLVILEDTDGDGKADKSSVFADNLHIPLSFEFGDGGVYISDEPHLTFLKDTNGDGKADLRRQLLTGFGTEDSHHSLHDFIWSPDGDLIFRESIFHHSQVETAYGPVRQQNSGWFRYEPGTQRLTSFGTYHSTNPWGVVFDDWGQHVASHPIFAAAFHSLDPTYPTQHPRPSGLNAYSGTCGQEFVDFATFPEELQGGYIKARYKPTNRIEIHRWVEGEFGFDEEYVSDLIFSSNLSFIPVDIRYGPRGAMYVCDWYNPVKGHAQYSLRDERRDRHSGRIWRITAKNKPLQDPPKIADASIDELLDQLKRPESRIRYWVRAELRERDPDKVKSALDTWVASLSRDDDRYRHHQIEAIWMYRGIGEPNTDLLAQLLDCDNKYARAAATQQLRHWHSHLPDAIERIRKAANDPYAMVRMEAAIAASYIGTKPALDAMLETLNHPYEGHLAYAIQCALGSRTLRQHWENDDSYSVAKLLRDSKQKSELKEPSPAAQQSQFDAQPDLAKFTISCLPEVMKFTEEQIAVRAGQPVKIVFTNPDATDHNLVIVQPGALEEVGMAANAMARDPKFANSDFIPREKRKLILQATKMIGPTRKSRVQVLRFKAPTTPGIYPYVCTFPGHWVVMKGVMVVAKDMKDVDRMLAAEKPKIVKHWQMSDFSDLSVPAPDEQRVMRGMTAFAKANCNQCHVLAGHGVNLGPDLKEVTKKYKDAKLLQQLLDPSSEINEKYQSHKFLLSDGRVISGVITSTSKKHYEVMTNLLTPKKLTKVQKDAIDQQVKSKVSAMPNGLLDTLTKEEITDLLTFLQSDGFELPPHLMKNHSMPGHKPKSRTEK